MPSDKLLSARTDAESGIARADKAIDEAAHAHSPLTPHIARYVAQRRAYALVAARIAASIERLEHDHG